MTGYATALDDCGGHNHSLTVAGVTSTVYHYHTQVIGVTSYGSVNGVPAGITYPVQTTGVHKCFRGNLTAADPFYNSGKRTDTTAAQPCCGQTHYYLASSSYTLQGVGTQSAYSGTLYAASATGSPSLTPSGTPSPSLTPSGTPSPSLTATPTATPSGTGSPGASTAFASLTLSALPASAFSGGALTAAASASLAAAIQTAAATAGCAGCTVRLTKVTETATGTCYLGCSGRRLQTPGALTVAYAVTGSAAGVASATSSAATFTNALSASVTAAYPGVTVALKTSSGAAAASSALGTGAIVGIAVGAAAAAGLGAAAAYVLCAGKKGAAVASSKPV